MKKVLIIEDDVIVATVYRNLLNNRGYEAVVETTGQTGLARMKQWKPDAVLLDIMLPGFNGVEVLKKIRGEAEFASVPVLVFTNAYVPNMVDMAKISGANHVFSKSTLTSRQLLEALAQSIPGAPQVVHTALFTKIALGASPGGPLPPAPGSGAATDLQQSAGVSFPIPPPGASPATEFYRKPAEPRPFPTDGPQVVELASVAAPPPAGGPSSADLRSEFLQTVNATLTQVRHNLLELSKASNEQGHAGMLGELHKQIRSLGGNAGFAGFQPAADLCSAFEILLKELAEKPKNYNPSLQRTVANTVDVLTDLLVRRLEGNLLEDPVPSILVVDDEVLSRRAVTFALEKARLKATELSDSREALSLASKQPFDLIFLDVQMPEINGFDLCAQIRAQVVNQKTPVIFVTSLGDFKSRVRSTLSGATDLIAKPFMFFELTVKCVSTLLQTRAHRAEKKLAEVA
ncbi:MAG: response regulator [Verrucomicrobia bacterium]|nr:response regulator [Verrucomicrobiota bacterium]